MVMMFDIHENTSKECMEKFHNHLEKCKLFYVVYRPGCPACDGFMPSWNIFYNEIASMNMPNVIVAKINESQLHRVNIKGKNYMRGVPHISYEYGNSTKEYDGDRSVESLHAWVASSMKSQDGGRRMKRRKKTIKKSTRRRMKSHGKSMKRKYRKRKA